MNQIRKIFQALSLRQRISLAVVALLAIAGIYATTHWSHERDFKPLYSDLSSEDGGAIVQKLKEANVEYRFGENNSTILVPSKNIPELRLQMASAGIPKSGRIGYELFDHTSLGTTDFTEQVNYHRAVEGELERSILAMAEVDQARVHITFPKDSVFTENREPAKASVMVKLKTGHELQPQKAQALAQLVASAVEGLAPEAVSVMDMHGNLLMRPKKPGDGSEPSGELLSYKKQLETETLAKINSVLDPLLGSARYRASVDVDCDQTSGEQSEETYDPTHSVITTSQRTEEGSIGRDSGPAVPGTQSTLPRPAPRAQASNGGGVARRTENTNYETSRTVRKIKMPQGIIRRMSVSVLIDHKLRWETGKGKNAKPVKIVEAPGADEIKVIHDVVAAASGFNQTRGDQLTVDSLQFEATAQAQPPEWMTPPPPPAPPVVVPLWKQPAVLIGAGAALLLLMGGVLLAIRSRKRSRSAAEARAKLLEAQAAAAAAQISKADESEEQQLVAAGSAEGARQLTETRDTFKLPPMTTTKTEVLTRQIVEEIRKDPPALAQIVRSWLAEEEEKQ